jgi:site-specific DNA-methyltransferase (adenine-specific)
MCITSPPYWGTRDYCTDPVIWDGTPHCDHDFNPDTNEGAFCSNCGAWKGQLGQEPSLKLYIKHIINVMDEVKRVIKEEGTCWLILGDTYASGEVGRHDKNYGGDYDRPKWKGIKRKYAIMETGLSLGCLANIPSRIAIEMTDNHGWIERNAIIWHKLNAMPDGAKNRFTSDYEILYLFVKNNKYYYSQILEPSVKYNKSSEKTKLKMRNKRSVWSLPVQPFFEAHFAVFPEKLIEISIRAGCPQNGIVLDPFIGSGTTGVVAKKLSRNYIGIDISKDYAKIAERRIASTQINESPIKIKKMENSDK